MPLEIHVMETGLDDLKTRLGLRIQAEEAKLKRFNFSLRVRMDIEKRIELMKKQLASL